jgi:hypothetical protein
MSDFKLYRVVKASAQYWDPELAMTRYVGKLVEPLAEAGFVAMVPKEGLTVEFIESLLGKGKR